MGVSDDPGREALAAVYELRLDAFVRTATAITGSREAGRDVVNDAFVTAIRKGRQFRGEGTLEAWLWRIVVRHALKTRRRQHLDRPDREHTDVFAANGHPDSNADVRARIALLPERQRLILFLRYYADLDYGQIATALGIRRGTVSAALHTAHQTLRTQLEEMIER
jgi:RNA polymerase sigma-70 factor (ECF subfamily)